MRKIALTAMFIAAAMTATAQQLSYAVSGKYAGNGQKIYLIDKLTDKAIDSVTVADSKFAFNGNAAKDALMGVKAKDSAWTTLFFNDGTPVAVNVNDSTLKGSPLNERLTKYDIEQNAPMKQMREIMKSKPKSILAMILSLMMVFSMMAMPVFADGEEPAKFPYSGENVNFIKEDGSAFGMFAPQEGTTCELDESGENVVIHYVPKNKTTYVGFNWGSMDRTIYKDASYTPEPEIKANADGTYDITLSKEYCGYAHPIAPVKGEYGGSSGTWTSDKQYYLAIPAFEEAPIFDYSGVTRIYGKSRYETAMLQADALKEILGLEKFNSIIVATGTNYADALSGAYLGYVKGAPILLVHDSVIKAVNNYIKENLAEEGTVYLLGGEKVVPDAVTEGLTGVQTKRLSGPDRYKTNLAILKEAGVSAEDIIVCTGNGFADSLSASAAKLPILLVNMALDADQMEYLKTLNTEKFYLAGGTGVISEGLEAYIKDNFGTVERLGGKNRYETSVMIAEAFFEKPDGAVVAFAKNYPDGLCGGTAAAYLNSPLLLVDDANIDNAVKYAVKAEIKKGLVLGGPTLVSDASVRAIFSMSEDDEIKVID